MIVELQAELHHDPSSVAVCQGDHHLERRHVILFGHLRHQTGQRAGVVNFGGILLHPLLKWFGLYGVIFCQECLLLGGNRILLLVLC
jgi:hypothetical protein